MLSLDIQTLEEIIDSAEAVQVRESASLDEMMAALELSIAARKLMLIHLGEIKADSASTGEMDGYS